MLIEAGVDLYTNSYFADCIKEGHKVTHIIINSKNGYEAIEGKVFIDGEELKYSKKALLKFRQKVVPGDTLIFRVELLAPIRRGISSMKGYVFVGEKVVCEAEFTAQIVKNK